MKKQSYRNASGRIRIIGIAGAEKGCGATHFAWSAANYLSNVKGNKVTLCNLSGESDYGQAMVILGRNGRTGITFVTEAGEDVLANFSGEGGYVILDLGCDGKKYRELLLRCDVRFLVGALNEWRCRSFITAALRICHSDIGGCTFLASFYSEAGMEYYKKAVGGDVIIIPYEPEPFKLHRDMLLFMDGVFGEMIP